MLDASEVVSKARGYLTEIMPEFAELKPKVEEMVLSQDTSRWKITFTAQLKDSPKAESLADLVHRRFIEKVVDIKANDGGLIAVRNPDSF